MLGVLLIGSSDEGRNVCKVLGGEFTRVERPHAAFIIGNGALDLARIVGTLLCILRRCEGTVAAGAAYRVIGFVESFAICY